MNNLKVMLCVIFISMVTTELFAQNKLEARDSFAKYLTQKVVPAQTKVVIKARLANDSSTTRFIVLTKHDLFKYLSSRGLNKSNLVLFLNHTKTITIDSTDELATHLVSEEELINTPLKFKTHYEFGTYRQKAFCGTLHIPIDYYKYEDLIVLFFYLENKYLVKGGEDYSFSIFWPTRVP